MNRQVEQMFVKSHLIGWAVALVLCFMLMYQQSKAQEAEFKAHVAQELLEKSQDAIVNAEVSR